MVFYFFHFNNFKIYNLKKKWWTPPHGPPHFALISNFNPINCFKSFQIEKQVNIQILGGNLWQKYTIYTCKKKSYDLPKTKGVLSKQYIGRGKGAYVIGSVSFDKRSSSIVDTCIYQEESTLLFSADLFSLDTSRDNK